MQLKKFYNVATKVSSKKSATTFGDLPDCSVQWTHEKCHFAAQCAEPHVFCELNE